MLTEAEADGIAALLPLAERVVHAMRKRAVIQPTELARQVFAVIDGRAVSASVTVTAWARVVRPFYHAALADLPDGADTGRLVDYALDLLVALQGSAR